MKPGIILATATLFASQVVFAQSDSDFELTDKDENAKTATISKYTGSTEITELVVPKVIGEYTITKISKLQSSTQARFERVFLPPEISITGQLMENQENLKCGVIDASTTITATPFLYAQYLTTKDYSLECIYAFKKNKIDTDSLCGTASRNYLHYLGYVSIEYSDNSTEYIQAYGWRGKGLETSLAANYTQAKYEHLLWAITKHLSNCTDKNIASIRTIDFSKLDQVKNKIGVSFSIENFNPDNQLSESTTIILDGNTAYNPTITDLEDFTAPSSDITSTIHYSRENTKDWNSVCLPFALSESDLPETSKIYTISGGDGSTLNLTRKGSVEAGEPCFIYSTAESWNLTLKDRSLSKDIKAGSEKAGSWKLFGSFTTQTIGAGKYKLADNGQSLGITNGTDAKVYPFRCYLEYSGGNSAPARVDVSIDEEQTITLVPDDGEPQQVRLYDLMGHPVQHSDQPRLVKGKNIIIR